MTNKDRKNKVIQRHGNRGAEDRMTNRQSNTKTKKQVNRRQQKSTAWDIILGQL